MTMRINIEMVCHFHMNLLENRIIGINTCNQFFCANIKYPEVVIKKHLTLELPHRVYTGFMAGTIPPARRVLNRKDHVPPNRSPDPRTHNVLCRVGLAQKLQDGPDEHMVHGPFH
jgi:hypothetical protein